MCIVQIGSRSLSTHRARAQVQANAALSVANIAAFRSLVLDEIRYLTKAPTFNFMRSSTNLWPIMSFRGRGTILPIIYIIL